MPEDTADERGGAVRTRFGGPREGPGLCASVLRSREPPPAWRLRPPSRVFLAPSAAVAAAVRLCICHSEEADVAKCRDVRMGVAELAVLVLDLRHEDGPAAANLERQHLLREARDPALGRDIGRA